MKITIPLAMRDLIAAAVLMSLGICANVARADGCDPANPPRTCYFYAPAGLTAKISANVGGANPGVNIQLNWSYVDKDQKPLAPNSPDAPSAIDIIRGIPPPVGTITWNTSDLSKDTTYTDQVRPYPVGSPLVYTVCSSYTYVPYNYPCSAPAAVQIPAPPPPPPPPSSNAGGPGCGDKIGPATGIRDKTQVLTEFSGGTYSTAVSIGYIYIDCK